MSAAVVRRLERVERSGGYRVSGPARVLLAEAEASTWFASVLDEVLASSTSSDSRAEALCQLLDMFGVGSIVVGRLS